MHQNRRLSIRTVTLALLAAALALPMGASSAAAKDDVILLLRCFGVVMQQGVTGMLEIGIERWSDDAEAMKLKTVLVEKSEDSLLKAIQKVKPRAGYMRLSNGGTGWDIQFARRAPLPDGGMKVVIATDRHVGFAEARAQGRSLDYQFTLAEIRLDRDGGMRGEGKLAGMAKVTFNDKTKSIEIENYGSLPVQLPDVQVILPKK